MSTRSDFEAQEGMAAGQGEATNDPNLVTIRSEEAHEAKANAFRIREIELGMRDRLNRGQPLPIEWVQELHARMLPAGNDYTGRVSHRVMARELGRPAKAGVYGDFP